MKTTKTTQLVMEYIKERSIKIIGVSTATGIPKAKLYASCDGRSLRDEEFLRICVYLGVDPMRFLPTEAPAP